MFLHRCARWSRVADAVIGAIRAVQEIRIECCFPADADTIRVFHDCAADGIPQANTPWQCRRKYCILL
jgi:hypothetical protein